MSLEVIRETEKKPGTERYNRTLLPGVPENGQVVHRDREWNGGHQELG